MFKYNSLQNPLMRKKEISEIPEKLYPDMDLPKWMTSKEKAVILFDDL
jgi:hypothetical protein